MNRFIITNYIIKPFKIEVEMFKYPKKREIINKNGRDIHRKKKSKGDIYK